MWASITIVVFTAVTFLIIGAKFHEKLNPVIDEFVNRFKSLINIFKG